MRTYSLEFKLSAFALAAVSAAIGGNACAQATAPLVVKIGHVAPTSGPAAHWGRDYELGAKMAVDDLNAKGVKIWDRTVKVELIAEDDANDPKQATTAANKLVDSKVNGVIGHGGSGTTIPASRIYSDAGIPQISAASTNPKYTRQGFATAFRLVADDVQLGSTLGKYAVDTVKAKTFVVVDDRTAYGQGVADEFKKAVLAKGGVVAGHEFTNDRATDFLSILTKLKAVKPDVLFFGGLDSQAGPMLKQMKQLGFDVKFMGGDGVCTIALTKLAGDAVGESKVICAEAGGVDGESKDSLEKFKQAFKAKNGVDVQIYSPYIYDAVNVMVDAMVKAGSSDPKKYLPALKKTDYKGITGPIMFDEKGDLKNAALTLYTYKSNQKTQIAVVRRGRPFAVVRKA